MVVLLIVVVGKGGGGGGVESMGWGIVKLTCLLIEFYLSDLVNCNIFDLHAIPSTAQMVSGCENPE